MALHTFLGLLRIHLAFSISNYQFSEIWETLALKVKLQDLITSLHLLLFRLPSFCSYPVFMQEELSACFLFYCQINLTVSWACRVNHYSSGAEASDNLISHNLIRYIPVGTDMLCVCAANYQPLEASYEKLD